MKIETLTAIDDDWLAMRLALWPEAEPGQHLDEMASFIADADRYVQFIARDAQGRGIGFAEASIRGDYVNGTGSSPVGYLEGLYVRPHARRQGAAKALVQAVADWAAAHGCRELASDTDLDNLVSQAVHERLGFAETERAVFFSRRIGAD